MGRRPERRAAAEETAPPTPPPPLLLLLLLMLPLPPPLPPDADYATMFITDENHELWLVSAQTNYEYIT